MAEPTLETMFDKRFADVRKRREVLLARRAEIDEQLHAVEDEYQRVKTAQEALEGKFARPTQGPRKSRAPSTTRAPRGAGGEMQKKILAVVALFPQGATAEVINSELHATDEAAKKPIAAALFRMKKNNVLHQPKPRGPYFIPPTSTREVFEPPAGR